MSLLVAVDRPLSFVLETLFFKFPELPFYLRRKLERRKLERRKLERRKFQHRKIERRYVFKIWKSSLRYADLGAGPIAQTLNYA